MMPQLAEIEVSTGVLIAEEEARRWANARDDFWMFRQCIHPEMITGWWPKQVARCLQQFYHDLEAGKRPKLAITAPPQHGKLCSDDTAILTSTGWKRHGQLKIGDQVFHPSGRLTRVLALSSKAPARMRVELTSGEVIWTHERHE
jgi:hypothetical protein